MARQVVRIEGLSDLKYALQELPKATATNVVKRALINAAEPILSSAETSAPVRSGRLKASLMVGTKLSRRQKSQHKKESKVEVFVGAGPLPQAHLEEFGSVNNAPHPFLRPAWDGNKQAALDGIKDEIAMQIEKARKRLARKAARLAAKNAGSK